MKKIKESNKNEEKGHFELANWLKENQKTTITAIIDKYRRYLQLSFKIITSKVTNTGNKTFIHKVH